MIFLNGLRGVSARVMMAKTGAWFADVDIDLEIVPVMPTGRAVLAIGVNVLNGSIDERASGRFGTKAKVRVVGGLGWSQIVPALHIHNDAGVFSTAAYLAIGSAVQETVVEIGAPKLLGTDYVFTRGPASAILDGVEWWVDILGITHVGPRIPLPAPPTADILTWDPTTKVAEVASDILLTPGMLLADPIRFGVATVDDVEHTFGEGSARAIAWCSTPSVADAAAALLAPPPASAGAKVVQALSDMARKSSGSSKLKRYPYRVVVQGPDGRLNLQSTSLPPSDAPPFLRLIDIWAGVPGVTVKLVPSSIVLVSFIDQGDPAKQQPIVVGFDPDAPPALEVSLDAIRIALGTVAAEPVMKLSATFATWLASVGTATGAGPPPLDLASTKTFTD